MLIFSVCVAWISKLIITYGLELSILIGLKKIILKGMGQKKVTEFTTLFSLTVLRVLSYMKTVSIFT